MFSDTLSYTCCPPTCSVFFGGTNKDLYGINLSKLIPFINSITIIKEKRLRFHLLKKSTSGFGHIHFLSENDAAIFYNYVKNLPFLKGPENTKIQFLPSKDENGEYVTYKKLNNENEYSLYEPLNNSSKRNKRSENQTLNETDDYEVLRNKRNTNNILNEADTYELLNTSSKRNKRSENQTLNETDGYEVPNNLKRSKRNANKILNEADIYELSKNSNKETNEILNPQYALYDNREQYVIVIYIPSIENKDQLKIRFSQSKKVLEISGEFQPLRSEQALESTITTGPFVLNLFLEKEIDVDKTSIMIKNGVATLSISKKQPKPIFILID